MKIVDVKNYDDIPAIYVNTPIEELLMYQNFNTDFKTYNKARLLVAMCMDNRKQLRLSQNFAYIIRTGGANLNYAEFKVSYAIAIGNVKYVTLIAHDNCGMVHLDSKKTEFIEGLVNNAGCDFISAEEHFNKYAPIFEIKNEIEFVYYESQRLAKKYPLINFVPMYYSLDDNQLSLIMNESLNELNSKTYEINY